MSASPLAFRDAAEGRLYRDLLAWLTRACATLSSEGPTRTEWRLEHSWRNEAMRGVAVDPDDAPALARGCVWYRLCAFRDERSQWPAAHGIRFDAAVWLPDAPVAMSFHLGHFQSHPSIPWPSVRLCFVDAEDVARAVTFGASYGYDFRGQPVGSRLGAASMVGGDPYAVRPSHGFREELARFANEPTALLNLRLGELSAALAPAFAPGQWIADPAAPQGRREVTPTELAAAWEELVRERASRCRLVHNYGSVMQWLFATQLPAEALTPPPGLVASLRRFFGGAVEPPCPSFARVAPLRPFRVQSILPDGRSCPVCACIRAINYDSEVMSGNPATPASDTEMKEYYRCADPACGHTWWVIE